MNIAITGTPGVGKTFIAKKLSKEYSYELLNDRNFAVKKGLGEFEGDEFVISLEEFEKVLNTNLENQNNVIIEGHVICEIKLKVDAIIVLTCDPEVLEQRLEPRGYKSEKVLDNVFCEGIEYCKKHALRNYKEVIVISNEKPFKDVKNNILSELKKRGLSF